jgi:hypothetical protein
MLVNVKMLAEKTNLKLTADPDFLLADYFLPTSVYYLFELQTEIPFVCYRGAQYQIKLSLIENRIWAS